jgi:hypothetical protein
MRSRLLLVLLLALIGMTLSALADPIAKVVAVVGSPTSSGPSGNRTLSVGADIFEKDKITVSSGNAQILFNDGTKLVVGPGSTLVISKYLMQGDGNSAQDFSINALRGTFRFITGKSPKNAYDIQTANATIGIRGTGFDFWVQKATGVALLKGKVRLCSKTGSKSCVDLNPTCEVGTTENGTAKKLTGQTQIQRLRANLPYIFNQAQLRAAFRLNVSLCNQPLTRLGDRLDTNQKRNEPPPCSGVSVTGGKGC